MIKEENKDQDVSDLTLDDIFAQAERKSSMEIIGEDSSDANEWMESSERSFKRFMGNTVTSAEVKNFVASLKITRSVNPASGPFIPVPLCTASLRSFGYRISDIVPDYEVPADSKPLVPVIYGHVMDYRDEFGSMIDRQVADIFTDGFGTKFKAVELSGCFPSVEDMRYVIMNLYRKLTGQVFVSRVRLHLDSSVKDDEGRWRTVADLIHTGYIEPEVTRVPNIVELVYRKLPSEYTDMLYTSEYKEGTSEKLI